MALYSFNHESFGKTSARAGAAGANAHYNADLSKTQFDKFLAANQRAITETGTERSDEEMEQHLAELRGGRNAADNAAYNARREATYAVRSHIIPPSPDAAKAWFDAQEKNDRKNARMSDRFIAALPRELTPEQCIELVDTFCRNVTQNRIPWHFALHLELEQQLDKDWNPHTHIIFRDRDIETGRRFLHTSAGAKERQRLDVEGIEHWSTNDFRIAWNDEVNRALERAGHDIRVDHRSLKEQGIDRVPQIHEGRGARGANSKGQKIPSRDHVIGDRVIPYKALDNRRSRVDYNAEIRNHNERHAKARAGFDAKWQKISGNDNEAATTQELPHSQDPHIAKAWQQKLASLEPRNEEQRQHLDLTRAQDETRKSLWAEQRRDRQALKDLNDARVKDHRAWSRQLNNATRQTVDAEVKGQFAQRTRDLHGIPRGPDRDAAEARVNARNAAGWDKIRPMAYGDKREQAAEKHRADIAIERHAIRGMPPGAEREAGRKALKSDMRQTSSTKMSAKMAELKPEKETAWKTLIAGIKHDRERLKAQHIQETATLSRQFAHERAAVVAHWHGVHLEQRAQRAMQAMAHARPGMAQQQTAAAKAIQAKAAASNEPRPPLKPGGPPQSTPEKIAHHVAAANREHEHGLVQRQVLTQQREANTARAQTVLMNAAARTPQPSRSKAGVAAEAISRVLADEPQKKAQQAAQSGRTLTTAERANAPPSVRDRLDARDRRTAAKSIMLERRENRQQTRDRGGGGRNR